MITFSVSTIKHQVTYSDVINIGLPVWEGLVRLFPWEGLVRLFVCLLFPLSLSAQSDSLKQEIEAYRNAPQYVKEGMLPLPDASCFLPAPTDGTLRGDTAIADAGYAISYFLRRFSPAVNLNLTKETHPQLTQLLLSVMNAGNNSIQKAKKRFARRRPYHHFKEGTPIPHDEYPDDFTSYPSGHAVRAWMAAMALSAVSPEHADAIMRIGYEIGQSRVILGFHYQSDVDAARLAASATFARLCAEKKFHKAIENAKKELK